MLNKKITSKKVIVNYLDLRYNNILGRGPVHGREILFEDYVNLKSRGFNIVLVQEVKEYVVPEAVKVTMTESHVPEPVVIDYKSMTEEEIMKVPNISVKVTEKEGKKLKVFFLNKKAVKVIELTEDPVVEPTEQM